MDTNVQALKNLYERLGGNPADVADISTNADMINAIAALDIGSGGGDVDQTYDPTSENAQSGVAVAQAMAALLGDLHFEYLGKTMVSLSMDHFVGSSDKFILVYDGTAPTDELEGYDWLKDHIVIGTSFVPTGFSCGPNDINVRKLDYSSSSAGGTETAPIYVFQAVE